MDTTQIVLLTLLGVLASVALLSLLSRMMSLEDNLGVEVTIIVVTLLLMYLVAQ